MRLADFGLSESDYIDRQLANPEWDKRGRVHDWRNYVPAVLMDRWGTLSDETRLIVYAMAEEQAGREEWD